MPDINFDCPSCGQNLEAPEDMAGDTVECPACQKPLTVPKPQAKPPPLPPPPATAPKTGVPARPPVTGGSGSPFSSSAMKQATAAAEKAFSNKCPECDADMKEDTVLCLKCGFNKKLGKKISTDFA